MQKLPLFNTVDHMDIFPVRVSTQAVRDRDFIHFHQLVQICFVMSGELRHIVDGREYIQRPGSCVFLLPYMSHMLDTIDSEDTPIIVYVWFHESFLLKHGYSFCSYGSGNHFEGKKIPLICDFSGHSDIPKKLVRNMISEFDRGKDISLTKMASMIAELFRLACTQTQDIKASHLLPLHLNKIKRAISYMEKNYADKISLDELAKVAGMSRRSFSSHFKNITGLTAANFLTSIRLSEATFLLRTDMLYDEIAKRCGLTDHTNLARTFVKYLGVSPTDFIELRKRYLFTPHQISPSQRYKWLFED